MTRKSASSARRRLALPLSALVAAVATTAVVGVNGLLIQGLIAANRAETMRLSSVQRLLRGGVSAEGVSDWIGTLPTFSGAQGLLIAAGVVASGAIALLAVMALRAGADVRRLKHRNRRLRYDRALNARARDILMERVDTPVAVLNGAGRPVLVNAAFDALPSGLIDAIAEKMAVPPVCPAPGPSGADTGADPAIPAAVDERTLLWTAPTGEGGRLRLSRWFLCSRRAFSLVSVDDPWHGEMTAPVPDPAVADAPPVERTLDTNDVLATALDSLADRIEATGADIRATVLPPVHGVARDLEALFRTIVETALYSEGTGRTPRIDIAARSGDGVVEIVVEDNGNGTQAWDLPEILYGRTLRIDATPGKGTKIAFDIPLASPDPADLSRL